METRTAIKGMVVMMAEGIMMMTAAEGMMMMMIAMRRKDGYDDCQKWRFDNDGRSRKRRDNGRGGGDSDSSDSSSDDMLSRQKNPKSQEQTIRFIGMHGKTRISQKENCIYRF